MVEAFRFRRRLRFAAAAACAALAVWFVQPSVFAQAASAQTEQAKDASTKGPQWPGRAITLVIPYPPGGTSDIIGRRLAERLHAELGQPIVVENKAGAATAIGAAHVARAANDGYTLLLSAGTTFTINPNLRANLPYRYEDFLPVAPVATVPFAFVVRSGFPAKDVAEFAEYAKANPGKVNNATNGLGSMVHLLGEVIAQGLGVKLTHIHYKGAAPAMTDMIAGIVDSNVEALANAAPNVAAGQYRALAVLSDKRQPLLPDVPTFAELGYPSISGETWYAVFAPLGTPAPVVERLAKVLNGITGSERFAEEMRRTGSEARSGSPADLDRITREQQASWGDLIRRLDLKIE
ncbi:MAG TPA: tripartite tricarboxylate transporter substrate binding protein [Burkholderiaceae bacterium]|nr:tripartite tricarboxylate transporter substrate binding protein [Burkholderiaceae bacterium]